MSLFNSVVKTKPLSFTFLLSLAGKEQAAKLSLPRASSLNENVDHSALLKLGATVSERVNRFDSKPCGEGLGYSKLQETRRIFEQRTLQVRRICAFLTCMLDSSSTPFYSLLSASGEASCHQPDLAKEGAGLRLPG